jgi:hypothetical protein
LHAKVKTNKPAIRSQNKKQEETFWKTDHEDVKERKETSNKNEKDNSQRCASAGSLLLWG